VGHTGTLDPAATGVLPICLGQATRLAEYVSEADKTYIADILLGVETDTYDADGEVVWTKDASGITEDDVRRALRRFEGEFDQTPPAFSAIKRQGVPAYKLARRGETPDLPARRVRVDRIDVLAFEPPHVRIEISCAKGFYVRSLAHDVGAALGVGASLSGLVRTRVGSLDIERSVTLDALRQEVEGGTWQRHLWAMDEVLLHWQALILGDENEARLRHGRPVAVTEERRVSASAPCRAYSLDGDFLAVVRREGEGWRPEKVFSV
jgi:tRNA pseudouridine55 synthase